MSQTLKICLSAPISTVKTVTSPPVESSPLRTKAEAADIASEKNRLKELCATLEQAVLELKRLQDESILACRDRIAGLSIAIAEKILQTQIEAGNYHIEKIVSEVLKAVPVQSRVTIRLNPSDLQNYKQCVQNGTAEEPPNVIFTADQSLERTECIAETDRGTVEYMADEQLKNIHSALKGTE